MTPTHISFSNIKGRDGDHPLSPVTVFTAPTNFFGKSAVLEAAKVALLGYHPRLGKQPSSTIKLASPHRLDMMCHLAFDSGQQCTRTFKRKTDGTIKPEYKSDLGDIPPVLMDTREYFEMTAADRIKFVFNKISAVAIDDDAMLSQLEALEALPARESVKAVAELMAAAQQSIQRRGQIKQSAQDWLAELIDLLKERRKDNEQRLKQASAAMVVNKLGSAPKSAQADIDATNKELEPLRAHLAELTGQLKAWQNMADRRARLESESSQPAQDTGPMEKELAELQAKIAAHKSITPVLESELAQLRDDLKKVERAINDNEAQSHKLKAQLEDILTRKSCPSCKSRRQGWQEEWQSDLMTQMNLLNTALQELRAERDAIVPRGTTKRDDLEKSKAADVEASEWAFRCQTIAEALKIAQRANQAREKAIAELHGLTTSAPKPDESEINSLTSKVGEYTQKLMALNQQEDAYRAWTAQRKQQEQSESAAIGCQVRAEIYKKAVAVIVAEQERIVASAFDAILQAARRFTDGLLRGRLEYRDGELGLDLPEGWASHETFSDSEEGLVFTGLSIALAQQSPVKVVVLDRLERFAPALKEAVIRRFLQLHAEGLIDGVIGADVSDRDYTWKASGFSLIQLSEK